MKVTRNSVKNVSIVVLTCAVVLLAFGNLVQSDIMPRMHVPPKVSVNVAYTFELADGAGASGTSGNLITDIGDQFVSNITSGRAMLPATYSETVNGTVYIALGNGTSLTYSDTQLTTEATANGFTRTAALTPTYASGTGIGNGNYYNFTISNKFTCATAAMTINATSLQWSGVSASNNNMFAEASIGTLPTGQAFAVNDNCTITWTITVQH